MRPATLTSRVTVASTVVALFVAALVAAALAAVFAMRHAEQRESHSKDVAVAALRVRAAAAEEQSALRGYALSASPRFLALFRQAHGRLSRELVSLRSAVSSPGERRRVAHAAEQLYHYYTDYAQSVIVITQIAPEAVRGSTASEEDKRRATQIQATLDGILATESRHAASASRHAHRVATAAIAVGIGALVASTGLVLVFGVWVRRSVARPLRRVASAAADVAAGDFSVRLEERGAAEAGALVSAFNSMTRALETSRHELLARNAQLVESERAKRDLIGMVSHEVRTPLASVVGFTSLLLQREFPAEERQRYLEIVDAQARRLASLAGDFLDVQLLDEGTISLVPSRFDLVTLVREQVQLFFLHPTTHRVELDVPSTPVEIEADRDRLAQVVGNLLSNALKYSPEETTVRVAIESGEDEAVVVVADEGLGIAPEDQERIFDKFFRTERAASTVGGTGLGLALARQIVDAHGGRIEVESEPGEGSTFRVVLRRAEAESEEPELAPAAKHASA